MIRTLPSGLAGFALTILLAGTALSAPVLKSDVEVSSAIVTVGDMFADAGDNAARPLFRAPAPGTAGTVNLDAVRTAAARAGITEFDNPGLLDVRVARTGVLIDQKLVRQLIADELSRREILNEGMSIEIWTNDLPAALYAEKSAEPASLELLTYYPGGENFQARIRVAGRQQAVQITGRLDLLIEAPHLVTALPQGRIIGPDDVEMRPVQLRYADTTGIPTLDQVIGKELRLPSRAGMMLKPSDLEVPQLIARNQDVVIYYRKGSLTLTVKGRALNAAAHGETVQVMNLMSKKVVSGIATAAGTVEIGASARAEAKLPAQEQNS